MTRFQQEISGQLGEYWVKSAKEEVQKAVAQVADMDIDEYGVARWKSNGNCPPDDFLEKLEYAGVSIIDYERTREESERQTAASIAAYKANRKPMTEEELFEARAAFGAGTVIVDVITGERITL